jgi:hypothetical protein
MHGPELLRSQDDSSIRPRHSRESVQQWRENLRESRASVCSTSFLSHELMVKARPGRRVPVIE